MPSALRAAIVEPESPPAAAREELSADGRRALLRTVSHELRTPLNAIIGFSDLLSCELYGPLGAPQYRDYAAIIRDSGHKLLKLVNDILEVARLEGGAAHLLIREEPLLQTIEDAIAATRVEAAAADVRIVVEEPHTLPSVMADARGLRTIFFNLFQRAVGASSPGSEIRVHVVPCCGRRRGWVHVQVCDTSGPVEPELLARLAEPFQAPDHDGADLGLPIVRLLTEALGGEFELKATSDGMAAVLRLRAADA